MDMYHVYDPQMPGIVEVHSNLGKAMECGDFLIAEVKKHMDGEWPDDAELPAIYMAPDDCEDPVEDGELVATATQFNIQWPPEDTDEDGYSASLGLSFHNVDFYCDYRMERTENCDKLERAA